MLALVWFHTSCIPVAYLGDTYTVLQPVPILARRPYCSMCTERSSVSPMSRRMWVRGWVFSGLLFASVSERGRRSSVRRERARLVTDGDGMT
ncbi:hypothetical protein EXIGLDRAFT_263416 [Exidia glandulosa HHB12029]|uniref:Secreted protein n=1 Tax=Exidia glandulosa HHB12029 TaxID=1314781 RepID=A0A165DQZ3_EXIGL|nr:hypothetical protein EXIGLDRAFT_263416 [Exidia glandulosa HHB12029]